MLDDRSRWAAAIWGFGLVDDIAKTRRRIYDDGQMTVIDLATRAP